MGKRSLGVGSLTRAIGVIGAVIVIMTGVTFAALQSPQVMLNNNSISSASADLRIGTSAASFAASRTGFSFTDLMPGGSPSPVDGNSFFLKNYGTAPLTLHISIGSIPVNPSNVDLSKVSFVIMRVDTSVSQTFTIQSLVDSYVTGGVIMDGQLVGGAVAEYKLRAVMTADAFSGQSASIDDLDLVFAGTGV